MPPRIVVAVSWCIGRRSLGGASESRSLEREVREESVADTSRGTWIYGRVFSLAMKSERGCGLDVMNRERFIWGSSCINDIPNVLAAHSALLL